ncbi:hypothetical protein [Nocardiopsis sp. NPDC057823]|uniref:hypothetical protein n=1 Tax=Nocardiopsis sp. NPDC057823 TaxID=3346256 RepID=UPI00366BB61A
MDEEKTWEPLKALLEQHFPAQVYSPEDRLNALIFHLRAQGPLRLRWRASVARERVSTMLMSEVLSGRMGALRDLPKEDHDKGRATLKLLVLSGTHPHGPRRTELLRVLNAAYGALRGSRTSGGPGKGRPLPTPIGVPELRERGYQVLTYRLDVSPRQLADPAQAASFPELLQALQALRLVWGSPPWRVMARRSVSVPQGWDRDLHCPRSHSAMYRTVLPGAEPSLPAVLAFVRGCGVTSPVQMQAWQRAHARAALAAKVNPDR